METWMLEGACHEQVLAVEIAGTQAECVGAISGQGAHYLGLGVEDQLAKGLDIGDARGGRSGHMILSSTRSLRSRDYTMKY